jgi:cytochrome c556
MARGNTAWPDDLPQDPEGVSRVDPSQAYAEAATLADLLAQNASDIPRAIAHKSLSDAKRKGFIKEAETLRRHALDFKEAARTRKVEQMQRALDRINTTCFACHSQYRDLSGDLDRESLKAALEPAISLRATSRR